MTRSPVIEKAMVLGAGMGSRMRDLTSDRPKPMVEVAGRPLVDHVLDRLLKAGVTDVVVNVHYKADVLEAHLAGRSAPEITISDERAHLLNTGGGVMKALPHFGEDPFIVHNSDSIWQEAGVPALQLLLEAWDASRMDTLLMLADPADALGYDGKGDFFCSADGRLTRRSSEHQDAFVFTGVSIAHPRLFANAPDGAFSLNVLWDQAMVSGRLFGVVLEGQWMHVGTPEAVAEASAAIAAGSVP